MKTTTRIALFASFLIVGCGNSNNTTDGPVTHPDLSTSPSADLTMTGMPDATTANDAAATGFTLTINNYLNWCAITENSVPFAATMSFPSGTVVNLDGMPVNNTFVWGYWTGTDGDTGSNDTMMKTTVTMTKDKSVLACCPFPKPASQTCP